MLISCNFMLISKKLQKNAIKLYFRGRCGSMIVDPLRSGLPRSGFDPSGGIPGVLPPGAVPPGARFDPFGPVGKNRPG